MTSVRVGPMGAAALIVVAMAACGAGAPTATGTRASGHSTRAPAWVKDSISDLDVYAPDGSAIYYFDAYDTVGHARTVIDGRVPNARYWSFTSYPDKAHLHDTEIPVNHGRYSVVLSASCSGIAGACVATGGPSGVVVLRLYVPVDLTTSGTGGVPLPAIRYEYPPGAATGPTAAPGMATVVSELAAFRDRLGALPPALVRSYPPSAPVPTPSNPPAPVTRGGQGAFANPDNEYVKIAYSTTRGNLVISARAPTFQADSFPSASASANGLGRPASASPESRYWSLCTDLTGDYTSSCLRDEQVNIPAGRDRFVVVVAPTCPVPGYANCLPAGPERLQRSFLFRVLLPSPTFAPQAFEGPYALTTAYVARPS